MRKNLFFILILVFSIEAIQSQAPQGFNYQGTVRDSNGEILVNQNVSFRFDIIQGLQTSDPTYTEEHNTATDDLGQIALVVGQGSDLTGDFTLIDWSLGSYFLGISIDIGNGYVSMGINQLMSVPYALYAENTASVELPDGENNGDILLRVWDSENNSWIETVNSSTDFLDLNTSAPSVVTHEIATAGGEIISDGGSSIISKGLVWSTSADPVVSLETKTDEGPGFGDFVSTITGLSESTAYFYRAYASTTNDTAYGDTYVVETLDGDTDYDGDNFTPNQGDCNDSDPTINPNGIEITGDGIDQNCDGSDIILGNPVYLHPNGVTIVAEDWAEIGDTGYVNGIEYTVVDNNMFSISQEGSICTSKVTDMSFGGYGTQTDSPYISSWDTSNVTTMAHLFNSTNNYVMLQDISYWDVSSVTDMSYMFYGAYWSMGPKDFNNWDVSNVTNMERMFSLPNGNQNNAYPMIANWDVSSVTDMSYMFQSTSFSAAMPSFNNWNVSSVTTMEGMFVNSNYNGSLSYWNTGSVTNMSEMFYNNPNFNQNISNWDVSNVTNMYFMFHNAHNFNSPLLWDVSSVTDTSFMFYGAHNFNQDISNWDVSNVTNMERMFDHADNFNSPLLWDVSNVTAMNYMFNQATNFNQDISNWDVSNVTNMERMFFHAGQFNQDLSSWNTDNVTMCSGFCNAANSWTLPQPVFNNCTTGGC